MNFQVKYACYQSPSTESGEASAEEVPNVSLATVLLTDVAGKVAGVVEVTDAACAVDGDLLIDPGVT